MQRFGFRIHTRSGTTVDNLVIHAPDREQAELKLRQMYHHCTVVDCKTLDDLPRGEGTDLEGAISLILGREEK